MCDPVNQFWWNWVINCVIAVGTVGAVIVALFGDVIRQKLYPPLLKLRLLSSEGEKCPVLLTSPPDKSTGAISSRMEDSRYYHLRVSNPKRWSKAENTQIVLTSIELPAPDETFKRRWEGEVPMKWRHQEIYGVTRTIGRDADCDLCCLIKGKSLELQTLITPNNLADLISWPASINLLATFVARSDGVDSNVIKIQISWDGKWEDGDKEMMQHLVIKQV